MEEDADAFAEVSALWTNLALRLAALLACQLVSAIAVLALVHNLPAGLPRLVAAAAPLALSAAALVALLDSAEEPVTTAAMAFLTWRLYSGKVVGAALGRGPLGSPAAARALGPLAYLALLLAPVMPAAAGQEPLQSRRLRTGSPDPAARGAEGAAGSAAGEGAAAGRRSIDSGCSAVGGAPPALAPPAGAGAAPLPEPPPPLQPEPPHRRVLRAAIEAAIVAAFVLYTCRSAAAAASAAARLLSLWGMGAAMAAVMAAASHPARTHARVALAPHFDAPLASVSLSEFWRRRWNVTQALVLRYAVYDPVVEGRLAPAANQAGAAAAGAGTGCADAGGAGGAEPPDSPASSCGSAGGAGDGACTCGASAAEGVHGRRGGVAAVSGKTAARAAGTEPPPPPGWRRDLATAATFLVSGLEHEIFHWLVLRRWGWRWAAFFALQAPLLMAERAARRAAAAAGAAPRPAVARLAVLLALGVAADGLFWPVLTQPLVARRLAASARGAARDACTLATRLGAFGGGGAGPYGAGGGGGGGCSRLLAALLHEAPSAAAEW
ncbi:hypothetical protein Rsub_06656 [Raphidocelis subcapitata]|uniref:Wax synthase domain-containing protein n=1 Tax=Raphidocelis subcapitata TaxID=307507 RepID=A0A2V0P6N0_9CHLO|nr:hypothetical protein Rsub_06656 [Raphidocelis subcapitata]|eukprot:GBF93523.1 hypothetical protein Rsub_06656 [Raphidocelis subcapitata]